MHMYIYMHLYILHQDPDSVSNSGKVALFTNIEFKRTEMASIQPQQPQRLSEANLSPSSCSRLQNSKLETRTRNIDNS